MDLNVALILNAKRDHTCLKNQIGSNILEALTKGIHVLLLTKKKIMLDNVNEASISGFFKQYLSIETLKKEYQYNNAKKRSASPKMVFI